MCIAIGLHRLTNAHRVCECVEPRKVFVRLIFRNFSTEQKVTIYQFKVNYVASSSSSYKSLSLFHVSYFCHFILECMRRRVLCRHKYFFFSFSFGNFFLLFFLFVLHESYRHRRICTNKSKKSVFYQFVHRFLFRVVSIGLKHLSITQIKRKRDAFKLQDYRRKEEEKNMRDDIDFCWS